MTKRANSFLLLHNFFAIMHVNSEAKVLKNAASKGGRRLPYLNVIVVFLTSFHRPCLVRHLHFFFFALEITSISFFWTEPKFWILNRTPNRAKVSNSINTSVNRYTPITRSKFVVWCERSCHKVYTMATNILSINFMWLSNSVGFN